MMNLLESILRMPRVVLAVMIGLVAAGLLAYTSLPKESFPAIDVPYFYVSTSQTGISPQDAERLLVKPIENRVKDLDDLKNYSATASTGHASVFLEFDVSANKDKALQDIRAKLDGVSAELPDDATEPTVTELNFTGTPVIYVAVYGNVPERALVQRAKDLQDALEDIPTVQSVSISGLRDEMMAVTIDLNKLETYGLTAAQLLDALAKNNMVVPGGTLDTGQGSFNVQVPGLIASTTDVFNLPLKTDGDNVVTFGDVASVTRTFTDATEYAHVNGQPAITLGISKKLGTNIIDTADAVRAITAKVTADWPTAVQHSFLNDQSESTKNLFRSLEAAVLTAIALVMVTCVATLGVRPALMIGTSIPVSFMIAFLVVEMMGMSINMMIMFGLVLAVGVLVDDPIVVVEYAERKLQEGVPKKEAFIQAARKMFVPVVSATFTTLGAFVPLLFWPGIIGKFMSYLPIIVIVVMLASLLSALVFMPVIGALIASNHVDQKAKEAADVVMYPDKFDVNKVRGATGIYVRTLQHLMRHPLITLTVGFIIIILMFMSPSLRALTVEAFPASEPEFGTVNVIARGNYSPIEIRNLLMEVEDKILTVQGVQDSIMTFAGSGSSSSGAPPDTIGQFSLQLMPWNERVKAATIFEEIRQKVKDISGLQIQIAAQENGPPAGKAINMSVESTNYDDLAPVVAKIRNYIENDLGDAIDIEDGRPSPGIDWEVNIDRVAAAKYGIGVRELSPYVQLVTSGVKLGTYRPDDTDDELDIRVRLPQEQRSFDALDSLRIVTSQGLVPVSNFISRVPKPKVANISRKNGLFIMDVKANLNAKDSAGNPVVTSKKVAQIQEWLKTQTIPASTSVVFGGAQEQIGDTNTFIMQALLAAVFLIALVLLIEYNSFYQVAVTLSTVVMSLAGVVMGMVVTGMSFSAIMTGLGIVALAGIVVKNGIVLIDTYNHYTRGDGVEPVKAMLLTAGQRVRPVLLTATVTALGVIPMAMNIEFDFIRREIVVGGLAGSWFTHLSAALVSGLFVSTALTLVMVPVMVTAPSVIKNGWVGRMFSAPFRGLFRKKTAVTPEGIEVALPDSTGHGAASAGARGATTGPGTGTERRDAAE